MINSTYNPIQVYDLDKRKISTNNTGVIHTCAAGVSTNVDLTLSDDQLLTGLQIVADGSAFGDSIDMQVVHPIAGVVAQFATSVFINADKQEKVNELTNYPAKLQAGLSLRCVYHSTGSTDVIVAVNYRLHKVLE